MKLIGTYFSPFSRRVAAALISRSIPYEHEPLNGYADPARASALNPVGKVPILVLDDGEHLIDSNAILDYINEMVGPAQALIPNAGPERRTILRLAAIAATIYERSTTRYFEENRPDNTSSPKIIDHSRQLTISGLKALDAASGMDKPINAQKGLNLATISAIVAFEYVQITNPDLDRTAIAPSLSAVAAALADKPPFAQTRP